MRKKNNETLKEVIDKLLETYRWKGKMRELDIVTAWNSIVGDMIAKHTNKLTLYNSTLFIYLDSAVLRDELNYARGKLVKSINEKMGKELVKEIILK